MKYILLLLISSSVFSLELDPAFPFSFRDKNAVVHSSLNKNINYLHAKYREKGIILDIAEYKLSETIISSATINEFFQSIKSKTGQGTFHTFNYGDIISSNQIKGNLNMAKAIFDSLSYKNCNDIYHYESQISGVYKIDPDGSGNIITVNCEMGSDRWTEIIYNGLGANIESHASSITGGEISINYSSTYGFNWNGNSWTSSKALWFEQFTGWTKMKYSASYANNQGSTVSKTSILTPTGQYYFRFEDHHSSTGRYHSLTTCTGVTSVRSGGSHMDNKVCDNFGSDSFLVAMTHAPGYNRGSNGIKSLSLKNETFKYPVDCQDAIDLNVKNQLGFYESGDYIIDADGEEGSLAPVLISCTI